MVHAQHRQHTTHGRQVMRHRDEHAGIGWIAEELVDQLLGFRQRRAQFLHHTAHGLPIRHAPVQLLHPAFERLRHSTLTDAGHALGKTLDAVGQLGMIELGIFEASFDVKQAGGGLHGQRRRRCRRGLLGQDAGGAELVSEEFAGREQALQRFARERELLGQAVDAVQLTTGDARPGLLRCGDPLARLRDERWIEAAQRAVVVIARQVMYQVIGLAHSRQPRGDAPIPR